MPDATPQRNSERTQRLAVNTIHTPVPVQPLAVLLVATVSSLLVILVWHSPAVSDDSSNPSRTMSLNTAEEKSGGISVGADSPHPPRLFVLGSSVAAGSGAKSASRSWVGLMTKALRDSGPPHVDVINRAEGGFTTASLIEHASRDLAGSHSQPPVGPGDVVVVALSLANEGLPWTDVQPQANAIADVYIANLLHVGMMIERRGATPIIAGVYPFDGYSPMHRVVLTRVNDELQAWGEAAAQGATNRTPYAFSINFLPAVDDGRGHWRKGLQVDEGHPNDAGHAAMAAAINIASLRATLLQPMRGAAAHAQPRLLAYGDSLTAGFHSGGSALSPWAPALGVLVGARVDYSAGSGMTAKEMVDHADNESQPDVCGEYWSGLRCLVTSPHVRYKHVIIMAGTNDIGSDATSDEALDSVKRLHSICHSAGVPTVAISVPPSAFIHQLRSWAPLNEKLKVWAESEPLVTWVEFPFDFSQESGLWEDDGLHMSADGYQKFAQDIAPHIAPLLE